MSVEITPSAADNNQSNPKNGNNVSIIVEKARHSHSHKCLSWGPKGYTRKIYIAAATGNWVEASSYDKIDPQWVRTPLTASGNTALHIAVTMKQTNFVAKLVECMSMQDLEIRMADSNTAFCLAAISGNVEIATILFHKNPNLIRIRGHKEMLPIQLASSAGHPQMTEFLFQKNLEDLQNLPFQDIVKLFSFTITNNIYTVASNLLDRYPELASVENEEGLTALQVLAQFPYDEKAPGYQDILSSIFEGMKKSVSLDAVKPSKALFEAVKSGNIMTIEFLLKCNPDLLMEVNSKGHSLLHVAIIFRQEYVYRLILSKGASMNVMMQLVDFDDNNILHLAGKLAPERRFGLTTHHVLMVNEELWFQEVEKIVPPAFKIMKNKDGWTPKELFYQEHKVLYKEAVSGLKGIANTLLVVSTLAISLSITGAISILTHYYKNAHTPIFKKETWYMIFVLSIALGTCLCAASMIFYSRVMLPPGWKPKHEYVGSRQTKLIFGNVTLIVSLFFMCVAIVSGAVLIFDFIPEWVFYVVVTLGCFAVALYLVVYVELWIYYVSSMLSFCKEALVMLAKLLLFRLWSIGRMICQVNNPLAL